MKYIIKLEDGTFVEQFFKNWAGCNRDIKHARKYPKSIAEKRLANLQLKGELIAVPNEN